MTEEAIQEKVKDLLPENITGEMSEDILALKKEIAKKYIEELKEKKGMGMGKLLIGEGKSLEKYLVSENKGDQIMDNIKGNVMDKLFGSLDTQSFDIGGITYNSIFEYLKPVKEKLDNAKTEAELKVLENEILTASTIVAPLISATNSTEYAGVGGGFETGEILRSDYVYPVKNAKITSPVGPRTIEGVHGGKEHLHKGIDISAAEGTPIVSVADGEVESVGFGNALGFNGYGNYMVVKLKNGYRVLYGHMQKLAQNKNGVLRKIGDKIKGGEQVGLMGSTGISTGPHLHFEIRKGTFTDNVNYSSRKYLDPIAVLPVTKDMINENILARVDSSAIMDNTMSFAA